MTCASRSSEKAAPMKASRLILDDRELGEQPKGVENSRAGNKQQRRPFCGLFRSSSSQSRSYPKRVSGGKEISKYSVAERKKGGPTYSEKDE